MDQHDDAKDCRVTVDEALAMLPDTAYVHTFLNPGGMLLGADWERQDVIRAITTASVRKLAGPMAVGMGHGLAVLLDGLANAELHHDWLFVKTRPSGAAVK